jgi:NTE family protein
MLKEQFSKETCAMSELKLAIACQGGGSHTAFTAGVLKRLLELGIPEPYRLVALSGTSGGGICAAAVWYGLLKVASGCKEPAWKWLVDFWEDNSAMLLWERYLNNWALELVRQQDAGIVPTFETSPYGADWIVEFAKALAPRKEYVDLKALLEKHIQFHEIPSLKKPTSPRLLLGAVDILSGTFQTFDSDQENITANMLLATAAIPTLFKAVAIGPAAYWDGLFSENPPVADFMVDEVEERPDEIWIVRINPQTRRTIPKTTEGILDRRNELSGNLSMNQELHFIEVVNRWIEEGYFSEKVAEKFKKVRVRWIDMSPELSATLDYASKLDRSPTFLHRLMEEGERQAVTFLRAM